MALRERGAVSPLQGAFLRLLLVASPEILVPLEPQLCPRSLTVAAGSPGLFLIVHPGSAQLSPHGR